MSGEQLRSFELFEEMVEDLKSLIISDHLHFLTRLLLGMTCKKYYKIVSQDLMGSFTRETLSRGIADLGSKDVFLFFLAEVKWGLVLDTLVERIIRSGDVPFLSIFERGEGSESLCIADRTANVSNARFTFLIGESGSMDMANYYRTFFASESGSPPEVVTQYYLNGLAYGGHLDLLKVALKEFPARSKSDVDFASIFSCALDFVRLNVLDWLIEEKVTFKKEERESKVLITSMSIFFDGAASLLDEPDPKYFLEAVKYLEKHGANIGDQVIMTSCITANAVEAIEYLDSKYGCLKSLDSLPLGYLFNLVRWGAYGGICLLVEKRPDLMSDILASFYAQLYFEAIHRRDFCTVGHKFLGHCIHKKYFTKLLQFLSFLVDHLGVPMVPLVVPYELSDLVKWRLVVEKVMKSPERNSFIGCMEVIIAIDSNFPSDHREVFNEARKRMK